MYTNFYFTNFPFFLPRNLAQNILSFLERIKLEKYSIILLVQKGH